MESLKSRVEEQIEGVMEIFSPLVAAHSEGVIWLLVGASLRTGSRSSWGADNVFANVATILTDAFWFSAIR